ncbi:MAG TPA: hypothetical protein PKL12_07950 [Bacteroidales bacterium]|jgi:hypothetical protein|nr:hypothetical protein [Bacteroidales bacterium]MBP8999985.1 hypothetical protein [Bacteroidales bacterium]NLZ09640.1 hypothetical protein [Bacteroidales bacterium]HNR28500.1 hypothetical protein [Bacteroidales bacterium]HNW22686.1 hypothetical protein [Bacteroidales bacterium]
MVSATAAGSKSTQRLGVPKSSPFQMVSATAAGSKSTQRLGVPKKLSVPNGVSNCIRQQKHEPQRAAKARTRESLGKKKIASRTRGVGELKFLQRSSALGLYWSGPGSKITARSSLAGFLLLVSLKLTPPGAVSPGFLSQVNKND